MKVARDRALKAWTFVEGLETISYGSGYPSGVWLSLVFIK